MTTVIWITVFFNVEMSCCKSNLNLAEKVFDLDVLMLLMFGIDFAVHKSSRHFKASLAMLMRGFEHSSTLRSMKFS